MELVSIHGEPILGANIYKYGMDIHCDTINIFYLVSEIDKYTVILRDTITFFPISGKVCSE